MKTKGRLPQYETRRYAPGERSVPNDDRRGENGPVAAMDYDDGIEYMSLEKFMALYREKYPDG